MGVGHITKQWAPIKVAMGERRHLTIATVTGPTWQRPNVATESSKFSPTSLSEMKADDVKNSYCSKTTRVHVGRNDYTNSIKINWSWYNLIHYCQSLLIICCGKKVLKNTMGNSLSIIHSSNEQMAFFDYCYCDRALLPATQSSNEHRDVGGPLLLEFKTTCSNHHAKVEMTVAT
jgi:hypothetical protein